VPVRVLAVLGRGLVDPTAPLLRGDDLAVLRGEGVFETARVERGRPLLLDAHLERLAASAARVEVALPPPAAWRDLVATALGAWDPGTPGVLRLVATKGPEGAGAGTGYALVSAVPAEVERQRREGVDVVTLTLGVAAGTRAGAPWLLGGVKSTSYAVNMAALRSAHAAGADDVIHVSADGEVLEGPTSTVLLARGDTLVTPTPDVGVLRGTTVAAVFDAARAAGVATEVRHVRAAELREADAVWLASSVRVLARVRRVDGQPLPSSPDPLEQVGVDHTWSPGQALH